MNLNHPSEPALHKLERQIARARRELLILGALVLITISCGASSLFSDVVQTRRLEIVDEHGQVLLVAGSEPETEAGQLALQRTDGKRALETKTLGEGAFVNLRNPQDVDSIVVGSDSRGNGQLELVYENASTAAHLGMDPLANGSEFSLRDRDSASSLPLVKVYPGARGANGRREAGGLVCTAPSRQIKTMLMEGILAVAAGFQAGSKETPILLSTYGETCSLVLRNPSDKSAYGVETGAYPAAIESMSPATTRIAATLLNARGVAAWLLEPNMLAMTDGQGKNGGLSMAADPAKVRIKPVTVRGDPHVEVIVDRENAVVAVYSPDSSAHHDVNAAMLVLPEVNSVDVTFTEGDHKRGLVPDW